MAGASLIFQHFMIIEEHQRPLKHGQGKSLGLKLINLPLRNLLISDILIRFCKQIPYAFVVIWCVSINRITPLQFGMLTAVEMVTAMLVYIPVAFLADKNTKKPCVAATFVFFSIFPLVLLFAKSF